MISTAVRVRLREVTARRDEVPPNLRWAFAAGVLRRLAPVMAALGPPQHRKLYATLVETMLEARGQLALAAKEAGERHIKKILRPENVGRTPVSLAEPILFCALITLEVASDPTTSLMRTCWTSEEVWTRIDRLAGEEPDLDEPAPVSPWLGAEVEAQLRSMSLLSDTSGEENVEAVLEMVPDVDQLRGLVGEISHRQSWPLHDI